jgi:hypothetical protein
VQALALLQAFDLDIGKWNSAGVFRECTSTSSIADMIPHTVQLQQETGLDSNSMYSMLPATMGPWQEDQLDIAKACAPY